MSSYDLARITIFDLPVHFRTPIVATSHDLSRVNAPVSDTLDFQRAFVGYNSSPHAGSVYFIGNPETVSFPHFSYLSFPNSDRAALRNRTNSRDHLLDGWLDTVRDYSPQLTADRLAEPFADLGTPRLLSVALRHLLSQMPADNARREIIILPDHVVARHIDQNRANSWRGISGNQPSPQSPYLIDLPWFTDALLADPSLADGAHDPHLTDAKDNLIDVRPDILPGIIAITPDALYISRSAALLADLLLSLTGDAQKPVAYSLPSNRHFKASGREGFSASTLQSKSAASGPIDIFYLSLEPASDMLHGDWIATPTLLSFDANTIAPPSFIHVSPFVIDYFTLTKASDYLDLTKAEMHEVEKREPQLYQRIAQSLDYDPARPLILPFGHSHQFLSARALTSLLAETDVIYREFNWPLTSAQTHRGALKFALLTRHAAGIAPLSTADAVQNIETDARFTLGGEAVTLVEPVHVAPVELPYVEHPDGEPVNEAEMTPGIRQPQEPTPDHVWQGTAHPKSGGTAVQSAGGTADQSPADTPETSGGTAHQPTSGTVQTPASDTAEASGGAVSSSTEGTTDASPKDAPVEQSGADNSSAGESAMEQSVPSNGAKDAASPDTKGAASPAAALPTYDPAQQDTEANDADHALAKRLDTPLRWVVGIRARLAVLAARSHDLPTAVIKVLEEDDDALVAAQITRIATSGPLSADADDETIGARMDDAPTLIKIAHQIAEGSFNRADYGIGGEDASAGEPAHGDDPAADDDDTPDDATADDDETAGEGEGEHDDDEDDLDDRRPPDDDDEDDAADDAPSAADPGLTVAQAVTPSFGDDPAPTSDAAQTDGAAARSSPAVSLSDDTASPASQTVAPGQSPDVAPQGQSAVPQTDQSAVPHPRAGAKHVIGGKSGEKRIVHSAAADGFLQLVTDDRRGITNAAGIASQLIEGTAPRTAEAAPDTRHADLQRQFAALGSPISAFQKKIYTLPPDILADWQGKLTDQWREFVLDPAQNPPQLEVADAVLGMARVAVALALNGLNGPRDAPMKAAQIEAARQRIAVGGEEFEWVAIRDQILSKTGISLDSFTETPTTIADDDMVANWQARIRRELRGTGGADLSTKQREFDLDNRVSVVITMLIEAMRKEAGTADYVPSLPEKIPFDLLDPRFRNAPLPILYEMLAGITGSDTPQGEDGGGTDSASGGASEQLVNEPETSTHASPPPEPDWQDRLNTDDALSADKDYRLLSPPHWLRFGVDARSLPKHTRDGMLDATFKNSIVAQFSSFGITSQTAGPVNRLTLGYYKEALGRDPSLEGLPFEVFEKCLRYAIARVTKNGDLIGQQLTPLDEARTDDAKPEDTV